MRVSTILQLIVLSLIAYSPLGAQDTITISPKDYEAVGEIYPGKKIGWLFKQGSDSAWNNGVGWKKFKPVDINGSMADSNDIFEGWFRAYIKIDSSFRDTKLFAFFGLFAAQDIFINGELIMSAGNTGINNKPYKANEKMYEPARVLWLEKLKPNTVHLFVWHIKDEIANPFETDKLKSQNPRNGSGSLQNLFEFVKEDFAEWQVKHQAFVVNSLLTGNVILFVLFALFLLLWWLNKNDKDLFRFMIFTGIFFTVMTVNNIDHKIFMPYDISYNADYILTFIILFFVGNIWGYAPVLLAHLFEHRHAKITKWTLFLSVLLTTLVIINSKLFIFFVGVALFNIGLLLYFTISSFKKIDRTKKIVVLGVFLTILFLLLNGVFDLGDPIYQYKLFFTLIFLSAISFPVSLIVYVAVRFRTILRDVETKADTIVRLSEEKRIQAENQQQILLEEVAKQTVELRNSLAHLKSTQTQLVQSEKMASLGELTAGIAHEIQNPLNFVNNFSELNVELVEELKGIRSKEEGDRKKGIGNSELEEEIINDIKENSEKINHHGKRAADIVKGMLQHSRSSTGQKEPTDINALCDEYLRLAYHGLRAKDKTFNAEFKTDFDETIGKINVQPQEMGRVILNLINNAFYACTERSRSAAQLRDTSYEPRVTVRTKQIPNPANPQTRNIAIVITDNGTGIPQHIKEKIFQPFFTTKPTGQGTGLGLSLAYDIVTKVHSGKLEVDSEEGKGTTFIVEVPY